MRWKILRNVLDKKKKENIDILLQKARENMLRNPTNALKQKS